MTRQVTVRPVERRDLEVVVELVHELAAYEREPQSCHLTTADLGRALFADRPAVFGQVAELDGAVVGTALWFLNFSTWEGVHGLYLEDLFVRPEARGTGAGRALLAALARVCVERGYARMDWSVLRWNTPSIDFYEALGAVPQDEWVGYRLEADAISRLAAASAS
ncbi:MAG: GNAT family N-acetyltransferase [Aeromicrobium sp.]|uniref:GNAT family N-acetyltransferase n=1 Tax=Aeromicrobium sp. TaxID=1871063 RepID=UPI0039E48708